MQSVHDHPSFVFYIPPDQHLRNEIQTGIYHYFQQLANEAPTEEDFTNWVAGLPRRLSIICGINGLGVAKGNLSFMRYVLEVRGLSLYEYLSERVSAEALALWMTSKEYGTSLHPNHMPGH